MKSTKNIIPILLKNTLTNKKDVFISRKKNTVTMYNCGPTVYDYAHIGNLRAYVFADSLRRILEYNGYEVKQVINITDVGHLTSDADEGEDKIESGAKREGLKVNKIIKRYTDAFFEDLKKLNINIDKIIFPKATEHIQEQIIFIQTLEEKGYTYKTTDGVYFDTSLINDYGKLGDINTKNLKEGARIKKNKEKRNAADFALWKFSPSYEKIKEKRQQEWSSPWGIGFPGWHIECSAMSMKHLGKQIDIHTGGVDHISVHHNNEIAQTESVIGKQFANYWMHNEHITIEGQKISKSVGNTIYLRNIIARGFSPLSLRYWFLTSHYNTRANFTWDALEGAHGALFKLHRYFIEEYGVGEGIVNKEYQKKFQTFINDDLDTPKVIALIWDMLKDDNISKKDKRSTMLDFDKALGFGFLESNKKLLEMLKNKGKKLSVGELPIEIKKLADEREKARAEKDFKKADEIRANLKKKGYEIKDTDKGVEIAIK